MLKNPDIRKAYEKRQKQRGDVETTATQGGKPSGELDGRNKDKYKQAIICAFGIRKQCLKSVDESTSILPDDSSLVEGTDYVCQHVKALEDSCLHKADKGMKKCAETKKQSQRNYDADSQNIVCSSLQIAYECAQEKLEVCSSETLQAVLDIIDKYFRPPACSPFDNKPNSLTSLPVVNCSNHSSVHQGQEECFTREGLHRSLPRVVKVSPSKVSFSLLPLTSMGCRRYAVINFKCVEALGVRLSDCFYQKGVSYPKNVSITTDSVCYAYAGYMECFSEVLPTCGCPTTKVYVETFKLYQKPPACSPVTVKTPVCDPETNKFIDSAATMLHGMSLLILTALVVCGLYNAM
ncbi:hypothetical protein C0Q70_01839 [Pomacea canaliculata]|uniref:DUF19 domain-containing protein n=1 Tax=Pomacea canaliculata TaxID=400727 RepID=A0A2T7Q0L0_POMCA|nr:hypothetical protein C0Q70_01839 [Pomacea canaliculata]